MKDDFTDITKLTQEITNHQAEIETKSKKIAAIQESYRLASRFSQYAGKKEGMKLVVNRNVDEGMLRGCLLSRGLYAGRYGSNESGERILNICTYNTMRKLAAKKQKTP